MSKRIYFLLTIVVASFSSDHSQMECGNMGGSSSGSGCDNWNVYSELSQTNTALKSVRLTIHVFQDANGNGNIPTV